MIATEQKSPMAALDGEHRVIEKVLGALDRFRVQPLAVPVPMWAQALDFLTNFADRLHHAKEEAVLFPMMAQHGLPQEGGPLGCMLHDHSTGRDLRAAMAAALPMLGSDAGAAARLSGAAGEYVQLMRFHIRKEDSVLFPMAASMFDEAALRKLGTDFKVVSDREVPPSEVERYLRVADELAAAAGSLGPTAEASKAEAVRLVQIENRGR